MGTNTSVETFTILAADAAAAAIPAIAEVDRRGDVTTGATFRSVLDQPTSHPWAIPVTMDVLRCEVDAEPCRGSVGYNRHRRRGEKACEPCREAVNQQQRQRLADPAYREAVNQQQRERRRERMSDPAYRQAQNQQQRERRATDHAYREAKNQQQRERRTRMRDEIS